MKRHFVLDENIVILAQKMEDESGHPDPACWELLRAIEANCHSLVFTQAVWERWMSQLSTLLRPRQKTFLTPNVLEIVQSLFTNAAKDSRFIQDDEVSSVDGLDDLPHVDIGDRDFVRAAASVDRAVLVTSDGPLRAILNDNGIPDRHSFLVCDSKSALPLAGPDEPES